MKYSYDALVYYGEAVEKGIERVARCGYDAIELIGEPTQYDTAQVRSLCAQHKIVVSSICSIFTGPDRDLVSPDPAARKRAVQVLQGCCRSCGRCRCARLYCSA